MSNPLRYNPDDDVVIETLYSNGERSPASSDDDEKSHDEEIKSTTKHVPLVELVRVPRLQRPIEITIYYFMTDNPVEARDFFDAVGMYYAEAKPKEKGWTFVCGFTFPSCQLSQGEYATLQKWKDRARKTTLVNTTVEWQECMKAALCKPADDNLDIVAYVTQMLSSPMYSIRWYYLPTTTNTDWHGRTA